MAVLAAGLIIFLAGCTVAVYRDMEKDLDTELGSENRMAVPTLMSAYGSTSGALSITDLVSDPARVSELEPFKGRVARIKVTSYEGLETEVKIPDTGTFDDHPKDRETMQAELIPVVLSTGKVVPARMEVTLFGE
jgi:hypothetical protein